MFVRYNYILSPPNRQSYMKKSAVKTALFHGTYREAKGKRVYPYASLIISHLILLCQQFIVMNLKKAKIFSVFIHFVLTFALQYAII